MEFSLLAAALLLIDEGQMLCQMLELQLLLLFALETCAKHSISMFHPHYHCGSTNTNNFIFQGKIIFCAQD